jgi:hypothetical protein
LPGYGKLNLSEQEKAKREAKSKMKKVRKDQKEA